ncbi:hypothetical protein [Nocardia sp. XZ_19_385]|uniref:hypothetical protein n=1 Tax=Nocardia sp. XZ_19_385 TaxID=2769488 RepID=UPI0018904954|nr:hypothetical protein [Nocardia sp. XZ_19_385]
MVIVDWTYDRYRLWKESIMSRARTKFVGPVGMGSRRRGMCTALAVTAAMLCAGIGASGPAYAEPPWEGKCTGKYVSKASEKGFVIQACQRAYSAAARALTIAENEAVAEAVAEALFKADESAENVRKLTQQLLVHAADASQAADRVDECFDAAGAVDAAANAAIEAADQVDIIMRAKAAIDLSGARSAADAAQKAQDEPTDSALADKAAEAEEKAVEILNKSAGSPELVRIPRLTPTE